MLAIAYGASIGGMGTPIGTAPNALFFFNWQDLVARGAPPLSFLQWMLAFLPYVVLLTVLFSWLLTAFMLPLPRGRLPGGEAMLAESRQLGAMTRPERRVAVLFGTAVLLWVTRGDLRFGDDTVIRGWAHWLAPAGAPESFLPDGVVAVGVAIAAFLVPAGTGDGRRIMDWPTVQKLPFDILFLLGGGMALADAFEPTGLSGAFGNGLSPMIGTVHPLLLVAVVAVLILLLSEVASNTAIAALFLPIVKEGAIAAHIDPRLLMLPATLAASCGFMLPIATPPNTIVFASGHVTVGQMAKAGCALDVLSVGMLVLVCWFWVLPLLGIDAHAAPAWLPPR
jgi:sodium-dependent dicarboxylate transporter 2/3/5